MEKEDILQKALAGDINAFQLMFAAFQNPLKSYLYRLVTDRNDVDDLLHDTFIRAFDRLSTFSQDSSLKTWVFKIATNLAYDHLKKRKRWPTDAQDQGAGLAVGSEAIQQAFGFVHQTAPAGAYDMKEHIDFCFTCLAKTLPIENQVALILKDIYDFSVREICFMLQTSEGVAKHLLHFSRETLTTVFDHRCALVNKQGVCDQCSQLNGLFNPKQDQQEERMKLALVKASKKFNRQALFTLRAELVKAIDPLHSSGTDLQDSIMRCTRTAIGDVDHFFGPGEGDALGKARNP